MSIIRFHKFIIMNEATHSKNFIDIKFRYSYESIVFIPENNQFWKTNVYNASFL